MMDVQSIGRKFKLMRKQFGLSQEKVAELMGVSFQQVQKYEKGTNQISLAKLQIISHAVGVPITYFFEKSDLVPSLFHIDISTQERRLLRYFRAIKNKQHQTCFLAFLRLVSEK